MENEEQQKTSDEMGLGDHMVLYHKQILEKNPLAISVALIISVIHLNAVPFSELVVSVIVCYVMSFYVVPAVCNADWSQATGSDAEEKKRQQDRLASLTATTLDLNNSCRKRRNHEHGFNLCDPTNTRNFSNPMSPLSPFHKSPSNKR